MTADFEENAMFSIRNLLLATVAAVGALTLAPAESKAQYYYSSGYSQPYYGGGYYGGYRGNYGYNRGYSRGYYGGGYGYNRGYSRGYYGGGYGFNSGRRGFSVYTPYGGFSSGRGRRW
jgi:hypothetical protein